MSQPFQLCSINLWPTYGSGYYKDEAAFLMRVEEDATTFKPHGDLIHTYTRPSLSASGKGKSIAPLSPEHKDAVVYEVYHVRFLQFYLNDSVTNESL